MGGVGVSLPCCVIAKIAWLRAGQNPLSRVRHNKKSLEKMERILHRPVGGGSSSEVDNRVKKTKKSSGGLLVTAVSIALCLILLPILVVNCTLLVKGWLNSSQIPSIGGIFPMIVLSDSMYPEFASGDMIICRVKSPEQVQPGDVISYYDPQSASSAVVTHRVQEVTSDENGPAFRTKGDFNNTEDPVLIPGGNLLGVYSGISIKGMGNVAMFMQSTQGLIVCVALPVVLLVGADVLRRSRYEKQRSKDKEALMAELEELRRMKAAQEKKGE